jgi:tetratricopeptide (TPR) repeat protein
MKIFFFIIIFAIYLLLISGVMAVQSNYFEKGIKLYQNKKFDESKIHFERDLVFNPKNEKSYLYLAKIFNEHDNDEELEVNLNNVLLINPQNDEAIYMLVLLKIKQSDYNQAKELIDQFILICKSFCSKKNEIQEKLRRLSPENAKINN